MYSHIINNVNDVKEFVTHLIQQEDLNFHPDTDFGEYISVETNEPTFNSQEIVHYNKLMDTCFSICESKNVDIYDLSMIICKSSV